MSMKPKIFLALSAAAIAATSCLSAGVMAADESYSVIDLSPKKYQISEATAVDGSQIAGWGQKKINGIDQPLFWTGNPPHVVNLNNSSAGFVWSRVEGVSNNCQAGWGRGIVTDDSQHAVIWNSTKDSEVDLNPANFMSSQAYGLGGNQEVGYGRSMDGGPNHALLWTGTAQSMVDLNPPGATGSYANATDGVHQVGFAHRSNNNYHATLWNSTAASAIDLNPPGYYFSEAAGVCANQQVGFGYPVNSGPHALLWYSTAASVVVLNPPGYSFCIAEATNGVQQVGWGFDTSGQTHALLWNGSAKSVVDLNKFLPDGFSAPHALAIDAHGNIVGYARGDDGNKHAIEWLPLQSASSPAGKTETGQQ
jgi:hypothetical protein